MGHAHLHTERGQRPDGARQTLKGDTACVVIIVSGLITFHFSHVTARAYDRSATARPHHPPTATHQLSQPLAHRRPPPIRLCL